MGHRPPAGFTWPVPPEELSDVPMLILEWTTEGRLSVRQETPTPAVVHPEPEPSDDPLSELPREPLAKSVTSPLAVVDDQATIAFERPRSFEDTRTHPVRDRVTWLGIGTLLGLVLAASTLPDGGRVSTATDESHVAMRRSEPVDVPATGTRADVSDRSDAGRPQAAAVAAGATTPAAPVQVRQRESAPTRALAPANRVVPPAGAPPQTRAVPTAAPVAIRHARPPSPDTGPMLREVHRYEAALSRMDAAAVRAAWPGADQVALAREFTGLREQRLRLDGCTVDDRGELAAVTCRGTLSYRPRVGDHTTRTTRGPWRFTLGRDGDGWVIEDVRPPAAPTP